MPDERELDCICETTTPPTWKLRDTADDMTELVAQLNALDDFQPKIGGMQAVRIKVTNIP